MRAHLIRPLVAVLALAGGCAEGRRTTVKTVPADQRASTAGSAIVVRGDYGPAERGPFTFAGRYEVRFVQRGAGVDFGAEVPFTAHLEQPAAGGPGKRVELFQAAARTGRTAITAHGRFRVVVDYGDSPFEIRFTAAASAGSARRAARPAARR
jgi:hypothetical protein